MSKQRGKIWQLIGGPGGGGRGSHGTTGTLVNRALVINHGLSWCFVYYAMRWRLYITLH